MTSTTPRILVVDDDPEIRKLLARYVESQGFRVLLAANCKELREQLATHHVDLIVLDVMLPTAPASTRAGTCGRNAQACPSSCSRR